MQRGDAAVRRPKELARIAQRVAQRLVRLAHILQVGSETVEELERGELAVHRQTGVCNCPSRSRATHAASAMIGPLLTAIGSLAAGIPEFVLELPIVQIDRSDPYTMKTQQKGHAVHVADGRGAT